MIESKLAVGPISPEIIESSYLYSSNNNIQLMIIPSKNQIDYDKGYVNNWTTKDFIDYTVNLEKTYPNADILICRDHCGTGFKNSNYLDLDDVYKTIETDIELGFDLIHVDLCHYPSDRTTKLHESAKCIEKIKSLNPAVMIEIGTDENTGTPNLSLDELKQDINFFLTICKPEFYVVQTGSLVKEVNQVGTFNSDYVKEASSVLCDNGIKLKEHNADYLSQEEIKMRQGIIGSMNIAPMLGVIQTYTILNLSKIYGIKTDDFLNISFNSHKWEKWLYLNSSSNKLLCAIIAGHYNFTSKEYNQIVDELNRIIPVRDTIIKNICGAIKLYYV